MAPTFCAIVGVPSCRGLRRPVCPRWSLTRHARMHLAGPTRWPRQHYRLPCRSGLWHALMLVSFQVLSGTPQTIDECAYPRAGW